MSRTLDTTALFETFAQGKEVNLPPDAKKRADEMEVKAKKKGSNRGDESKEAFKGNEPSKPNKPKKQAKDKKPANKKARVSRNKKQQTQTFTTSDVQAIQLEYEKKLRDLESKLKKEEGPRLSKNEQKLLNAIRSEKLIQENEKPTIGRSRLLNVYKIGPKYLDTAIEGLITKNIIKREEVNYSAKIKTYSWEIL